jgi:hypothetical protein
MVNHVGCACLNQAARKRSIKVSMSGVFRGSCHRLANLEKLDMSERQILIAESETGQASPAMFRFSITLKLTMVKHY